MARPLTIEISGTSTKNRGAQLMAAAIADRLRRDYPVVRLVATPTFGNFEDRARYGFHTTTEFAGWARSRWYARLAPSSIRSCMGVVEIDEVDVVLDASGFAFSDQFGPGPAAWMQRLMRQRRRYGTPFVLLPQALGPFEDRRVRRICGEVFDQAALVHARDPTSHENAARLCSADKLRLAPDFTISSTPIAEGAPRLPERYSAVVPNMRMVDRTDKAQAYRSFLQRAVASLQQAGMDPCFVIHDQKEDARLAASLQSPDGTPPILSHKDPQVLKYILGRATAVVGSRFHALVSALSQGTPCIGTSWSHKYQHLFEDFGCSEMLVRDLSDEAAIEECLRLIVDDRERDRIGERTSVAAALLVQRTEAMWAEVRRSVIDPRAPS